MYCIWSASPQSTGYFFQGVLVLHHQDFRGAGKDLGGAKPLFATLQKRLWELVLYCT